MAAVSSYFQYDHGLDEHRLAVPQRRCPTNMQQIHRRATMHKYNFNKITGYP